MNKCQEFGLIWDGRSSDCFHTPVFQLQLALPSRSFGLLPVSVHRERGKSSTKTPNIHFLVLGTLTFSSSYLMVVFICWQMSEMSFPERDYHGFRLPSFLNSTAPSETSAIAQLSVKPRRAGESAKLNWFLRAEMIRTSWRGEKRMTTVLYILSSPNFENMFFLRSLFSGCFKLKGLNNLFFYLNTRDFIFCIWNDQ